MSLVVDERVLAGTAYEGWPVELVKLLYRRINEYRSRCNKPSLSMSVFLSRDYRCDAIYLCFPEGTAFWRDAFYGKFDLYYEYYKSTLNMQSYE
jgi:hypothetical protein